MTNAASNTHRWAFLDGKLRTCRRCQIQQRLEGDTWAPSAPEACSGA